MGEVVPMTPLAQPRARRDGVLARGAQILLFTGIQIVRCPDAGGGGASTGARIDGKISGKSAGKISKTRAGSGAIAFSSGTESGSREENASNQGSGSFHGFNETVKRSGKPTSPATVRRRRK